MDLLYSSQEYLFNLRTTSPGEAKRLWGKEIKEKWENKCSYCGSKENLTLDHIIPRSKGGADHLTNVLCACEPCNKSKAHFDWEQWYLKQPFFDQKRYDKINEWIGQMSKQDLRVYRQRKNINY